MAGGMDLGGGPKRGRKALDAPINLVPFIDLMAVTISFLVMTAVWNQADALSARPPQRSGGGGPVQPELAVEITSAGLAVVSAGSRQALPRRDGGLPVCRGAALAQPSECDPGSLVAVLSSLRAAQPDRQEIEVRPEDGISFEELARVLDALHLEDGRGAPLLFPEITVTPLQ